MKTKEVISLLQKAQHNEDISKILEFVLEQQERLEKNAALCDHLRAKLAEIKKIANDRTELGSEAMENLAKIREIVGDV